MAKGRKSRMDLRREAEALEAKQREDELEADTEEEEGDEDEDEDAEVEAELDPEADIEIDPDAEGDPEGDAEGDDDEDRPKKKKVKKPKKAPAAKKAPTKRSRVAKEVRTRAVWVVFDNGSKVVEKFPYNQKEEAEALLAKKVEEKKGTFYINLVKEEIKE